MFSLRSSAAPLAALAIALASASCAAPLESSSGTSSDTLGDLSVEGTVVSIDMQPWTYDGHAVIELDVAGRGTVAVRLPARWNLCKAPPVDVDALAVGMRVQAVGAAGNGDGVTVCSDPGHRLVPLDE